MFKRKRTNISEMLHDGNMITGNEETAKLLSN